MAQKKYRELTTNIEYTEKKARRLMMFPLKFVNYNSAAELAAFALTTHFEDVDYDPETRARFKECAEFEFDEHQRFLNGNATI